MRRDNAELGVQLRYKIRKKWRYQPKVEALKWILKKTIILQAIF